MDRTSALIRADAFLREGRLDLAIAEHQCVLESDPADEDTADRLIGLYARQGYAHAAAQYFIALGERLLEEERHAVALAIYRRVLFLQPANAQALTRCRQIAAAIGAVFETPDAAQHGSAAPDLPTRARLAADAVRGGDARAAADQLTTEMAGDNPHLLMTIAEIRLRAGKYDEALALVEPLAANHPDLLDETARLGVAIAAAKAPDIGFRLVEIAVTHWAVAGNLRAAVHALDAFVDAAPDHMPAVVWMLDLASDAGLTDAAARASARLDGSRAATRRAAATTVLPFSPRVAS